MSEHQQQQQPLDPEFVRRVAGCIAKAQHIPVETIQLDSTFEELKIESLDAINILFTLEAEFDIQIPDEGAKDLKTVRDLANGVHKIVQAAAARK